MYVCTECKEGPCIRNCCTTIPVFREYIRGDDLYSDPMGEPYKGLTEFIQTPMSDPIHPVMEASAKTAEELRQLREEHQFRLRTEK
jgi:hypothetical protein